VVQNGEQSKEEKKKENWQVISLPSQTKVAFSYFCHFVSNKSFVDSLLDKTA